MSKFVKSWHATTTSPVDPREEEMVNSFRAQSKNEELLSLYGRHVWGMTDYDALIRRVVWRSLCKSCGAHVRVGPGALFRNIETFELGDHVFIGAQSYIQGRHDGRCQIGDRTWIGPQAFLDARDMVIGSYVGWGPGARLLGSQHTGLPLEIPIITTDLEIRPVRIHDGADIGTSAVILPDVVIGEGAIVGAGAVVTKSVDAYSIVSGVPAKFMRWREGYKPS